MIRKLLVTNGKERKYLVKVADFGLSKKLGSDSYYKKSDASFAIKWAAPEIIEYYKYSTKSDVWAFGVTMWELYTNGKAPYTLLSNEVTMEYVIGGKRLDKPDECPSDVWDIVQSCWAKEADDRPTFASPLTSLLAVAKLPPSFSDRQSTGQTGETAIYN